jgi:hypothetical protein
VRQRIICKKDDYEEDGELPGVKQHGGLLPVNIPEYYIILISAKGTGKRRRASADSQLCGHAARTAPLSAAKIRIRRDRSRFPFAGA